MQVSSARTRGKVPGTCLARARHLAALAPLSSMPQTGDGIGWNRVRAYRAIRGASFLVTVAESDVGWMPNQPITWLAERKEAVGRPLVDVDCGHHVRTHRVLLNVTRT